MDLKRFITTELLHKRVGFPLKQFYLLLTMIISYQSMASNGLFFFVSAQGDDTYPGTYFYPFRTLERAKQEVRKYCQNMDSDITVYLREGMYVLDKTFALRDEDAPSNGYKITYTSYCGEQAIISGGKKLEGWVHIGNGIYKTRTNYRFRQLYIDTLPAIRARQPNIDQLPNLYSVLAWNILPNGNGIKVDSGIVSGWNNYKNVELVVHERWDYSRLLLDSFYTDVDNKTVLVIQEPCSKLDYYKQYPSRDNGTGYFLENAYEFLDAPGEWYQDASTGEVYLRPYTQENLNAIYVPYHEKLFDIKFVHNYEFKNLSFRHSQWLYPSTYGYVSLQAGTYATGFKYNNYSNPNYIVFESMPSAIELSSCSNIVWCKNTFTELGAAAVSIDSYSDHISLDRNQFYFISGNAIQLGSDLTLFASVYHSCLNNKITNNEIWRIGEDYYGSVGIRATYTRNTLIEHNYIHDLPYTGISSGWGWICSEVNIRNVVIAHNHIHHTMTKAYDGGAIYTISKHGQSIITANYIHDVNLSPYLYGGNSSFVNAIFNDEGSDSLIVFDNVISRVDYPTRLNTSCLVDVVDNQSLDYYIIEHAGILPETLSTSQCDYELEKKLEEKYGLIPNPSKDGLSSFYYRSDERTSAKLLICDLLGKVVYETGIQEIEPGPNIFSFQIKGAGLYLVTLIINGKALYSDKLLVSQE